MQTKQHLKKWGIQDKTNKWTSLHSKRNRTREEKERVQRKNTADTADVKTSSLKRQTLVVKAKE